MPESRHSSTLDIKVNARALAGLQRTLSKVFSKATPREFNTAVGSVNRSLEVNLRTTNQIVKALGKVKEGTSAWTKLAGELRGANKQGRELERTLNNLNAANRRAANFARGGGPGGGGGRAAGGGGIGGVPFAGRQAPMPGMGAIQTTLMSIPMAGMVAAGSLMAAAQTYQSRRRYEQAKLEAAPYLLGGNLGGALGYRGPVTRQVAANQPPPGTMAGRVVTEVGTGATRRTGSSGLTTAEAGAGFQGSLRPTLEGAFGQTVGGGLASLAGSGFGVGVQEITGLGSLGRASFGRKAAAEAERRRQASFPTLAEAMGTQRQGMAAEAARERALIEMGPASGASALINKRRAESEAGKTTTTEVTDIGFDIKKMWAVGLKMGFDPTKTMQMAGQFGQAAGRAVSGDELGQAMALQRQGVGGVGQTGQLIKQLRYAGDISGQEGGGNMQQVANLIGSAVALGLEGSEIAQYLQDQTAFLDQMAKKGIGLDIDKMRDLEATLAGSGINARWRASSMARGFITGSAEVGVGGPKGAAQFRLMRAHGFSGSGGMEEMYKVRMAMQDPKLAEQMGLPSPAEAMSNFIEQLRVPGAGKFMQAGVIQSSFRRAGLQAPGAQEALALSKRLRATKAGEFQIDTEGASRLVGAMAPSEKAEAGIEAQRVGIGAGIAGSMQKLSRTTNNMAATFENVLGGALDATTQRLENFSAWLDRITAEGGYFKPFEDEELGG